jgi:hypothetical protein
MGTLGCRGFFDPQEVADSKIYTQELFLMVNRK